MPSNKIFTAAAAVFSLSGMATALVGTAPYGSYNSTAATGTGAAGAAGTGAYSTGPYSGANATTSASKPSSTFSPDLIFCPGLNNQVFTDARGHHYVIQCALTHDGIFIDITVSNKRAVAASLDDCMLTCDEDSACVGTSFNKNTQQCKYYSSIGAPVEDADYDFAYTTNLDGTTVTPGEQMTSTVFTTTESTIYSCAATVTNCPLRNNGLNGGSAVVTDTVALYTTVCPYSGVAASTIAAAPVACTGCPVSAGTATVYSATVQQGTSTVVPVATQVVNYVQPSNSAVSTNAAAATTVAPVAAASSTVEAFTGAAGHVEAGMGMAAVMAMAVLAL